MQMNAEEVKNLAWVQVTDWNSLPKMDSMTNVVHVEEEDLDNFLHNLYTEIMQNLNISYDEAVTLMETENKTFYSLKKCLFEKHFQIKPFNDDLLELEKLLYVPIMISEPQNVQTKAEKVINDFMALNDAEKSEVMQRLSLFRFTKKA